MRHREKTGAVGCIHISKSVGARGTYLHTEALDVFEMSKYTGKGDQKGYEGPTMDPWIPCVPIRSWCTPAGAQQPGCVFPRRNLLSVHQNLSVNWTNICQAKLRLLLTQLIPFHEEDCTDLTCLLVDKPNIAAIPTSVFPELHSLGKLQTVDLTTIV